ncbi:MAG TPA: sulfotransferase [Solirubrobacteraceae bacterium]|jgi:hypothetical protein|nr:sulfotransferase [Solirubrobacteraceae bacterium]
MTASGEVGRVVGGAGCLPTGRHVAGEAANVAAGAGRLPSEAGRVPDFFVVGHHKCGTTALHQMLRSHPQIYMPAEKSPRFLAADLHPPAQMPPGSRLPRTLAEYLALFAPARPEQRVGEASETYLMSHLAAGAIAALQPSARIVAILREPASFLRSLHLQFVESRLESENDLRRALALEEERRRGERIPPNAYWPAALRYSEHVRYVEQLRRFHAVFPREQVLVLIYDDFRASNETTVREVLRFLGVDHAASIQLQHANPTVRVRSPRLHELVHAVSVGRTPFARYARAPLKLAPRRLRRGALRAARRRFVYAPPLAPDEALMRELRVRFEGEVAALGDYLGRDLLTLWGYDRVD